MLLCISSPPEIWLLHFSNKSRQNSLLVVSVKWLSVNVNMFALLLITDSSQSLILHCIPKKHVTTFSTTRNTFCRTRSLSNATFFHFWSRDVHVHPVQNLLLSVLCTKFHENRTIFIAHQQLTRDIDIANLSVRLSVRYVPVSDENGLTYRHSFFHRTVAQPL